MISYYMHGKYKQHKLPCEDSLTATLFDNLKHLPDVRLYKILNNSLLGGQMPEESGKLLYISFWEKWSAKNTGNSNYVEPDVFLRFEEFDIIIEAKKNDSTDIFDAQIANELMAYFNEYRDDKKKLFFIPIGQYQPNVFDKARLHESYKDDEFDIRKTNWKAILENVAIEKEKEESPEHEKRILNDIIQGFELHQFFRKKWLKDLCTFKIEKETFGAFLYTKEQRLNTTLANLKADSLLISQFNYFKFGK